MQEAKQKERALMSTMNADEMDEYLAMKTRILRVFEGDKIEPSGVRKHDQAIIFTVTRTGMFIVRGTILELNSKAIGFERGATNNVTH